MAELLAMVESWWSFDFVRRAVVATTVMSVSVAPVGCFLVLRRLSLAGEALAHAIVPGIALAFLITGGLSVVAMLTGGVITGIAVAVSASLIARVSLVREDAGLASLYLIALALGIFILSSAGSGVPLTSFLFGRILGMSNGTLVLIAATATATLVSFALILRPLVVSTMDAGFYNSQTRLGWLVQVWFMLLVVANLIASFRALGTLMAVGLMILPAASARYWASTLTAYILVAIAIAMVSCWLGIGLSLLFAGAPTGPSIVLVAGVCFLVSLLVGPYGLRGDV